MYKINSKVDKPDIPYMIMRVEQLMKEGISLRESVYSVNDRLKEMTSLAKRDVEKHCKISNANSTQQIIGYMEKLGSAEVFEVSYENGKWSTKEEVLSELAAMGYEFASLIMEYRDLKKCSDSVDVMVKSANIGGGRVRPTINVCKTNRISYRDPALMNIPNKILWSVVGPRKAGYSLYSVDIKNQEPHILINFLKLEELRGILNSASGIYEGLIDKIFQTKAKLNIHINKDNEVRVISAQELSENCDVDPATYNPEQPAIKSTYLGEDRVCAVEVSNTFTRPGHYPVLPETIKVQLESGEVRRVSVVWDKVRVEGLVDGNMMTVSGGLNGLGIRCTKTERSEMKAAWNAVTYRGGILALKRICKNIDAKKVLDFYKSLEGIVAYNKFCDKLANRGIQEIKTVFGTVLKAGKTNKAELKRSLSDLPIQGTGSDIMALLIKRFDYEMALRGISVDVSLYFTRLDELIVEVNPEFELKHDVSSILLDVLEHSIDDWTPFKLEVKKINGTDLKLEIDEADIFD